MIYRAIGLMSGSSLDGLDIAFITFHELGGQWSYTLQHAETITYTNTWAHSLKHAAQLSVYDYYLLHTQYGVWIAQQVNAFINKHQLQHQVQLIASHGHTVLHHPAQHITTQIGDGASIAAHTGINVVSDLRNIDVALNGQGAPIVPMGEQLLFAQYNYLLNLGGIANITIQQNATYKAFDICPANRVLDALAAQKGLTMDVDGILAANGKCINTLLTALNNQPYYQQAPPKSLANEFGTNVLLPIIQSFNISVEDALHTYIQHIIHQLHHAVVHLSNNTMPNTTQQMLVTGGGALNKYLIHQLQKKYATLNINTVVPDKNIVKYKEALIMALLGILRWREENTTLASVTGATRSSIGGAVWIGQEA